MTIPASMPVKASYIGDGVTVNFPIPFVYFENTDGTKQIKVVLADADGENEIIQYENSNFTITDAGNVNGTLNMKIAPETGKKLSIVYNIPIEQLISYKEFGRLPSESIENALDKLTAILKQHQEIIDRCVKVTISGNQTPQELLDEVYAKLDSATDIASQANEATAAADNATAAVESAEETLAEVTTYVDSSKSDIANLVSNAENSIDETISQATTEVKAAAREVAQETLSNEVVPYVNQSAQYASAAKASETAAKSSQTAAAASATSAANTVNGFDAHAAEKQSDFDDNATAKTTAFDSNYTSKLNYFNSNAASKQAQVDASAETARKWAIGTIQEQPSGSAKYWAEYASSVTEGTLNETQITNCLTKIPQNLNLELSDGILTLKSGSKVYVPNGLGIFNEIIVKNDLDLQYNDVTDNTQRMVFVKAYQDTATFHYRYLLNEVYSGDTPPTGIPGVSIWYDTLTNKIKSTVNGGTDWTEEDIALPICIFTRKNGVGVISVDHVFNGFGYIGNTVFALPGIEGRIPNGFNTDGSLNSAEFKTTKVSTINLPANYSYDIFINTNGNVIYSKDTNYVYDEYTNLNIIAGSKWYAVFSGKASVDSTGHITSLTPNTAFHAVDYSEYAREVGRCAKKDESNEFTGRNSFNDNKIIVKSTTVDWTETASRAQALPNIVFYDKNNNEVITIAPSISASNNRFLSVIVRNQNMVSTYYNFYTNLVNIPTPASSASSTEAITAAWVRNLFPLKDNFKVVSTLPASPDANTFYFIPEEE